MKAIVVCDSFIGERRTDHTIFRITKRIVEKKEAAAAPSSSRTAESTIKTIRMNTASPATPAAAPPIFSSPGAKQQLDLQGQVPAPEEAGREDQQPSATSPLQQQQQQQQQPSTPMNDYNNNSMMASSIPGSMMASSTTPMQLQQQQQQQPPLSQSAASANNHPHSVATLSQAWEYDDVYDNCYRCSTRFSIFERKHHCRHCGKIFCHNCSRQKALVPPSAIVLVPKGGKKVTSRQAQNLIAGASFSPREDPDRMLTYVASSNSNIGIGGDVNAMNMSGMSTASSVGGGGGGGGDVLLYGKGLEERFQLAREPLRVCQECHLTLQPLQADLQRSNSHAMRFNHIDPTHVKRLFNSPVAFTLGHEVRKAAYTLNNLLPQPKRRLGVTMDAPSFSSPYATATPGIHQQCQQECSTVSPTMAQLDGLRIPAKLLEHAKGIAVLTAVKGGFGLAGFELGTGLVVARLNGGVWSAPSAIGTAGVSWGALLGAQVSDHVFVCMTEEAVEMLMSSNGSVQLGADIGVAVGPVGRALEADYGASPHHVAPIYTYSLSKGLYAGVSLDGKVIVTRHNVNEKFYGRRVAPGEILQGRIPTPPAAQPLYDALTRCQVYVQPNYHATRRSSAASVYTPNANVNTNIITEGMEYGEWESNQTASLMGASNGMTYNNANNAMSLSFNSDAMGASGFMNTGGGVGYSGINPHTPAHTMQQPQATTNHFSPQQHQQPMQAPPPPPQQQPQPTIARIPPLPAQQQLPMPPAADDQHSYAGMSDITGDPGY